MILVIQLHFNHQLDVTIDYECDQLEKGTGYLDMT